MKPSSVVNSWTNKEIYDSHSRFSDNFLWKDFKRNVDNLRATTEWLLQIAAEENDLFELHMRLFPETLITNTGCPVWHTPSTKWYSHKSHGPGLGYEFGLAIRRDVLVWFRGSLQDESNYASEHDLTKFRGGSVKDGKDKWRFDSLYNALPLLMVAEIPAKVETYLRRC